MSTPTTGSSIPPAVQALIDKEEIRTVIYRFCRGSDRRIRNLVQSVYHPDAIDNHGSYDGPAKDFYDAMNSMPPPDGVYHHIGQSLVELGTGGSTASAETYCTATTIDRGADGQEKWTAFLVRYIDKFEKREGEWKIVHRFVAYDGMTGDGRAYLPKSSLGTRDESDYSRKIFND